MCHELNSVPRRTGFQGKKALQNRLSSFILVLLVEIKAGLHSILATTISVFWTTCKVWGQVFFVFCLTDLFLFYCFFLFVCLGVLLVLFVCFLKLLFPPIIKFWKNTVFEKDKICHEIPWSGLFYIGEARKIVSGFYSPPRAVVVQRDW